MTAAPDRSVATAIGGLIALAVAMGIGRFVYTPILPYMVEGLGLTKSEAGLIASANFLGYLVGALAAASASLPGGRRRWFLCALAMSGLTTAAMGLTVSVGAFIGLRFAGGVASAFVLVFSSALILERLALAGRSGLSAVHFAGVGVGISGSAVLIATLAQTGSGWTVQWIVSGAISLMALVVVALLVRDEPDPVTAKVNSEGPSKDRRLVRVIIAYGLFGFGYVITATFISTIARSTPELNAVEPFVWLAVGLAAIPSVAFWSRVGMRFGNGQGFAIACVVQAVGVALSVLTTNPLGVIFAAVLLGGTFMGITALGLIHARAVSQGDPRRSLALMTAAFGLGQMIGPGFAGYAYGFAESFLVPSLVASAALLVAAGLVMEHRQSAQTI